MGGRGRDWLAAAVVAWLLGWASGVQAQVEANRATAEELQTVRGIGPVLAARLVEARAQRPFADWADLQRRVAGIGWATAQRMSQHGLRVNGRSYGAEVAHGRTPVPAPAGRDAAADTPATTMRSRGGTADRHPPAPVPSAYPRISGLSAPTPPPSEIGEAAAPRAGHPQPAVAAPRR